MWENLKEKVDALCNEALEANSEETEHIWTYDAWHLALEQGWVDNEKFLIGMGLRNAGAYLNSVLLMVPHDCDWLIRDNKQEGEEGGYFANVSFPGPNPVVIMAPEGFTVNDPTQRFKTYAKTPAMALLVSCLQAWMVIQETLKGENA